MRRVPFSNLSESDLMALCIWSEARGEPLDGQHAVAWVMMNRLRRAPRFGNTLREIVLAPWQFSWFNGRSDVEFGDLWQAIDDYTQMVEAARAGTLPNPIGKRDHFHAEWIDEPEQSKTATDHMQIGQHIFYSAR